MPLPLFHKARKSSVDVYPLPDGNLDKANPPASSPLSFMVPDVIVPNVAVRADKAFA